MTIYDYAKLGPQEKWMLINAAQLMEQYKEGDTIISIYFLNSFFVEVVSAKGTTMDFIPFERGYKKGQNNFEYLKTNSHAALN
ncbi:MAG: hypothetical protein K0S33_4057 [Bacteroidetes bacterium]|jgi:hypothetical protein|nr:hypothetical protein [Bacteroidota bacterium]